MKRITIVGALAGLTAVAAMSCRDPVDSDVEAATSALINPVSSQLRAYKRADGVAAILLRQGSQSPITELRGPPGARTLTNIGGVAGGTPWGYVRSDNHNVVVYIDSNRHLHELSEWNGAWVDNDFYSVYGINAPLAATANQDVFGYVRKDGINVYIYTDGAQHIIEVRSNFGGSGPPWLPADLTASLLAQPSASQSPYPYRRKGVSLETDAIVYTAADLHIHQFELAGGTWTDHDLSVESGDLTTPYSQPWANANGNQNVSQVVYTAADFTLHRLYSGAGCSPAWCSEVLPADHISPTHRPVSFFSSDNSPSVVYVQANSGSGDNLRLLSKQGGLAESPWTDAAIFSGGPLGNAFGYVPVADTRTSVVVRQGTAGKTGGYEFWRYNGSGGGGAHWSSELL